MSESSSATTEVEDSYESDNSTINSFKQRIAKFNRYIGKHLIVATMIVFVIFVTINSFLFFNVDKIQAFNNKKGTQLDAFVDGVYFTSTTMSTVGYGDITPQSKSAKVFVVFMQLTALFLGMRLFDTASQMRPKIKKV